MTPFEEWQAAARAANGPTGAADVTEWEAALRAANEKRTAELKAGGEFAPKAPPEYDPVDESTDSGRLMRSWLETGRGSAGYKRNKAGPAWKGFT